MVFLYVLWLNFCKTILFFTGKFIFFSKNANEKTDVSKGLLKLLRIAMLINVRTHFSVVFDYSENINIY